MSAILSIIMMRCLLFFLGKRWSAVAFYSEFPANNYLSPAGAVAGQLACPARILIRIREPEYHPNG